MARLDEAPTARPTAPPTARPTAAPAAQPTKAGAGPTRPLRADAQRNRDRLIDVATTAFTDSGVDVALEDVARTAEVGIGTLYRHFPTREALVMAVYRKQIDDLEVAAQQLPRHHAPAEALRLWMRGFVEYGAVKRGLVVLLRTMMDTDSELFDHARTTLRESAESLMTAAADAGEIRPDFAAGDVIRALGGICMATDRPDAGAAALTLVDLVFDGLRYGAPASP